MATDEEIEHLGRYIRHYLNEVIGVHYPVRDSPAPGITFPPNREIHLPLTKASLEGFFSPEFVVQAVPELLFSIVVGLAYHEAAHDRSGEKRVDPHLLNNIICDANDFTVVPEMWPGSIPFTLSLVNADYARYRDLADLPFQTMEDELTVLLHLGVSFLRKLRVKHDGKDIRSLPEDHPLHPYFERLKPIMKTARKAPVTRRPELVKELYEVVRDFWRQDKDREEIDQEKSLSEALERASISLEAHKKPLHDVDAQALNAKLGEERTKSIKEVMDKIREDLENGVPEGGKSCQELPFVLEEEKEEAPYPPEVDDRIVSSVRAVLIPKLFERSYRRRAPSLVGDKFHPGRFYEIKTRPQAPRVKREVLRITRALDEVDLILCFDRSGSMGEDGGAKEKTAIQVAATLYKALATVPKLTTILLTFNDVPHLIKGFHPLSLGTVLKRIPVALKAEGGTNLPLALHECIRLAEKGKARKRVIILLTDGDTEGSVDVREPVERAGREGIEVVCVGVQGADPDTLIRIFGMGKAVYVDHIYHLPQEFRKVIIASMARS